MLRVLIVLILIKIPGVGSLFASHALYISVIEISHEDESASGEIRLKIFADDLREALYNGSRNRIRTDSAICTNIDVIKAYIESTLELSIDKQSIVFEINECELIEDSTWLYLKFDCPRTWNNLGLKASYLTEIYPTQTNMLSIVNGDEKRFARLTLQQPSVEITF